jgi:hypothetical protein
VEAVSSAAERSVGPYPGTATTSVRLGDLAPAGSAEYGLVVKEISDPPVWVALASRRPIAAKKTLAGVET